VIRAIVIALCVYVLLALFALLFAERMIFQPPPSSYRNAVFSFTHVPLAATDSLAVVYLPNADSRYTILYSHGNAEDLGHVFPLLEQMRDLGFAVVAYDYRGYGESRAGPPTVRKALEDAEAAYQYATTELGVAPERLILYGSSVGSGPAVELAARHRPAGLILHSAFTSTYRVITRVPVLPFDRFQNLSRLRDVHCPVLVIHGTRDFVVPFSHGRVLFEAAREPKQSLWVEGAGHNNVVAMAGERYAHALADFLQLLDRRPPITRRDRT
jgi:fermentation-respiration switch protein FrsA (DUF1100 family)